MARGDGKAVKGRTKGSSIGVKRMALGGFMGGKPSGGNQSPSGSMGGFGGQTSRAEAGGGGGGGLTSPGSTRGQTMAAERTVNRSAKGDRLSPTQLGPGALKEYANQRMAEVFDESGNFRAPPTASPTLASPRSTRGQAMAADRAVNTGQVVNTATKGDLLSTKMPSYATRSVTSDKPGAATAFKTLDAAGYGPYIGNKMPNSKAKGSGSAGNSFEGFGIDPSVKARAEDIISGQTKQSVKDLPFDGSYRGSLPTVGYSKTSPDQQLAGQVRGAMLGGPRAINTPSLTRGEILASERMVNRATKGDTQQSVNTSAKADLTRPDSGGGSLASPPAAAVTPKPRPEIKPASASPKKATPKEGSVFVKDGVRYQVRGGKAYNFNVPGGSKRGKPEKDRRFGEREPGGLRNKRDGGVVRKTDGAATRGKTRGRYI